MAILAKFHPHGRGRGTGVKIVPVKLRYHEVDWLDALKARLDRGPSDTMREALHGCPLDLMRQVDRDRVLRSTAPSRIESVQVNVYLDRVEMRRLDELRVRFGEAGRPLSRSALLRYALQWKFLDCTKGEDPSGGSDEIEADQSSDAEPDRAGGSEAGPGE